MTKDSIPQHISFDEDDVRYFEQKYERDLKNYGPEAAEKARKQLEVIKRHTEIQEVKEERKHIGYVEREEGFYKLYAQPSGSIVTQAFILCKYCRRAIHPCGGPKLNAVCFHCYDVDPELR